MVVLITETTQKELVPLRQFKEAVDDLKADDFVLLRFLRARNLDVIKAEEMLRYAFQWREEIDIKNSVNWEFPTYYKSEMAYNFYGKDFEGAPALWIPVGKWNGKALVDKGEGENLLRWAFSIFEEGLKLSRSQNCQGTLVIDLNGLSYSQVSHIESLKLFLHGCQKTEQCYPELIKNVFIINAPWVFTFGWSFIKGVISRNTMEKIHIFGTQKDEWMPVLLSKFPKDSILPELVKDINGN